MRIVFKHINNFRDLGNYPTMDGRYTLNKTLYRSGVPFKLDKNEIDVLHNLNISTVIDLRTKEEVKRKPNALAKIDDIKYYNVSLLGDKCPEFESDIPQGYINILSDKDTIKKVFEIILNSEKAVLFNCTAGKDRTGVIAMLLLKLANCYEEDILVDYQISYTYIKEDVRKMHKDNPDLPAFLGGSKLEYMEETLKKFNKKYKNINEYFLNLGFTSKDIKIIKSKIV